MDKILEKYNEFKAEINNEDIGEGCKLDLTFEEFKGRVTHKVYTRIHLRIKCPICGKSFERTIGNFRGCMKMCKTCALKTRWNDRRASHEEFVSQIYDLVKDEYTVVGEFVNWATKIRIRHNFPECDYHEFEMAVGNFITLGYRCPRCATLGRRKTHEEFVNEVWDKHGDSYTVLGEYITSEDKVLMRHNSENCENHEWDVPAGNFLYGGTGCPKCQVSKGEKAVEEYLLTNSISHTTQHVFKDCRDIMPLRFDFAIYDTNGDFYCLVEYDGEYHYVISRHKDGEQILANQQRRDKIKNDYCEEHGIRLIRIPYWEQENIPLILEKELKDLIKTKK